jgi:hypothetical protein
MDPETNQLEESPHLATLRSQFRTAILSKRKADARGILGKLVAMSGDEDDRRNLDELIKGVESELKRYTGELGSIKKRLQDGTTLDAIQQELGSRISHWRAFANDLGELALARDGLPAHEDPKLKERLKVLEGKLAEGAVENVLSEWEELGAPEAAAGGLFVQIVQGFSTVLDQVDQAKWPQAAIDTRPLVTLLESEEAISFRDGCKKYLDPLKKRIDWEVLLLKQTGEGKEGRKQRRILLEDLIKAKDEIQRQIGKNTALKDLLDRVEEAIEIYSRERLEQPESTGGVKVILVILAVLFMIVVVVWLYMRNSGDPNGAMNPHHPVNPLNPPLSMSSAYS